MLQRTLSRTQGGGGPGISWRPLIIAALVIGGIFGAYLLLPVPGPHIRISPLTEAELTTKILALRLPEPPPLSPTTKKRAAFGQKLFTDRRLSPNGQAACASCHLAEKSFSSDQAPTLINAAQNVWFGKDGRADSLAAASLLELEGPKALSTSRTFVVNLIKTHYAADYQDSFGPWPAALQNVHLPVQAMPLTAPLKIPIELSAYTLSTLGSFPLLTDILKTAQGARLAPAIELSHRALAQTAGNPAWDEAWKKLTLAEQEAVNTVFANAGKALAAYQAGLIAAQSGFDRFAGRVASGKKPNATLDTGFGATELRGLELFLGPAGCSDCHSGPTFSDQRFHNLGLSQRGEQIELGRAAGALVRDGDPFTCFGTLLKPQDVGAWPVTCERPNWAETDLTVLVGAYKTPTLRNIGDTAPYMHDGRFATLDDVLTYYSELNEKPAAGRRQESLKLLDLTQEERQALLAFLGALTSPVLDQRTGQTLSAKP